jgi:hypothetical protein
MRAAFEQVVNDTAWMEWAAEKVKQEAAERRKRRR